MLEMKKKTTFRDGKSKGPMGYSRKMKIEAISRHTDVGVCAVEDIAKEY